MINYVKGDLFGTAADIIVHGCNCVGGFCSGVAGQIAKKFPEVKESYLSKFDNQGWHLGDVQFVRTEQDIRVFANCGTQKHFLPRGQCHADYEAIKTCLYKVKEFAKMNDKSIAMPKIGAGLAGGDWAVIEAIVSEVFSDYNVAVYYLE